MCSCLMNKEKLQLYENLKNKCSRSKNYRVKLKYKIKEYKNIKDRITWLAKRGIVGPHYNKRAAQPPQASDFTAPLFFF